MIGLAFSCKTNNVTPTDPVDETKDLKLVQQIENGDHTLKLFTSSGLFRVGYNKVYLQIVNKDGSLLKNSTISWSPLMHMSTNNHSCPYSAISNASATGTLYEGYIIFQMASNSTEYWTIDFNYLVNNNSYTVTDTVAVNEQSKQQMITFLGADSVKYLIAMVEPQAPKTGINDMTAMVFKMQDMMTFPIVNNYVVKIDPRMPSMGNHGSPNNEDLKQNTSDKMYHGKLTLTMTGYWKINLQLLDANNNVLKGEAVTDMNESSSIFFEVEI